MFIHSVNNVFHRWSVQNFYYALYISPLNPSERITLFQSDTSGLQPSCSYPTISSSPTTPKPEFMSIYSVNNEAHDKPLLPSSTPRQQVLLYSIASAPFVRLLDNMYKTIQVSLAE